MSADWNCGPVIGILHKKTPFLAGLTVQLPPQDKGSHLLLPIPFSAVPFELHSNIFDMFFLPQVPFISRKGNLAPINEPGSLRGRAVECMANRSVPVDSLNVPKSTSRRFRHFKHLLRSCFEIEKKKDSLKASNKCVLCGFYTNNVLVRP